MWNVVVVAVGIIESCMLRIRKVELQRKEMVIQQQAIFAVFGFLWFDSLYAL